MRNARIFCGLLLLASLCSSCTKQDLSEDDNLIINQTVLDTGDDPIPPPTNTED